MKVSQSGKFQTFNVSPSGVATGKEDPKLPQLKRISSLELTAPQIAAQINASRNWHISTSTVQRRLRESGLHGRIAAKKPLLKDTNKKKRLAWAKKHEQWTLDRWNSALWSPNFEIFGFNRLGFVRRGVGERIISACVVPTMKHGGGGVMVWGCFNLEFKAHLASMATTALCSDMPSHLVCA